MEEKFYKRYKDLPLFLNAQDLKNLFGISLTAVYSLLHQKIFSSKTPMEPTLKAHKRQPKGQKTAKYI